ncbi:MAG: OsmC family protein [Burkholderiaceae bacterium]|nr:OsmC family protein [Burkholderiaceae bacterium]
MSEPRPRVLLRQQQDFQFEIDFGEGKPRLLGDEGPPLGQGAGPTPVQLLAAAVGNCLSDSLLFALRKFKQAPEPISCEVTAEIGRNADNRLRVLGLDVALKLGVPAAQLEHLDRVLVQFESFCTVGASVAQGIPLKVTVHDSTGAQFK